MMMVMGDTLKVIVKMGPLFSDLSQLHQLIHLKFGVDFSEVKDELLRSTFFGATELLTCSGAAHAHHLSLSD